MLEGIMVRKTALLTAINLRDREKLELNETNVGL